MNPTLPPAVAPGAPASPASQDAPPILGTWRRMYVLVLAVLLAVVLLCDWLTQVYLRGGRDLPWYTIGLSIMATQASAITFLSPPGQAYEEGMGFIQFYFG